MTVHALLLGVERPHAIGAMAPDPVSEASFSVDAVYNYLTIARVADANTIVRPPAARQQDVADWFRARERVIGPDDTAIILFCGHGWRSDAPDENGWWLQDGPLPFATFESTYISTLHPAARVIVIAACCYAAPGPAASDLLRIVNFTPTLRDRVIMLSASGYNTETNNGRVRLFIHVTVANALARRDYHTLEQDYNVAATVNNVQQWRVTRPAALATSAVLAPK